MKACRLVEDDRERTVSYEMRPEVSVQNKREFSNNYNYSKVNRLDVIL